MPGETITLDKDVPGVGDPNAAPADTKQEVGNLLADLAGKPKDEPALKPAEGEQPAKSEDEPAPIDYKAAIKLPEGVELQLDDLAKIAGEHKLPVEAAQTLVDLHVKALNEAGEQVGKLWADTQKQWQTEVMADPELGGNNLASMKATVAKAIEQYAGDPNAVREALILTGSGNNPAIIRLMYRMAKALTEGAHVEGGPNSKKSPASAAQAMYPDLPSQAASA